MPSETRYATDALLDGTPYLVEDGRAGSERFTRVAAKADAIRNRAVAAADAIASEAARVLPQFELAVRSDLVSESNRMEGIPSSAREIRELARVRRDLLDMDVSAFLRFVRDDPRLLESLGLYRAYGVADDWAHSEQRPREFELRSLHALVMPALDTGGSYKRRENRIGGSAHVPTHPAEVRQAMQDLASWFGNGSGDAALDAAVVHAWITHIHPFDDGNGRMARLMANLALIQAHYPPLLLRSGADRGEYLDALAASDDGDILPLYDLFVRSLRRVVKTMEHPNYVVSKIRGDLLSTSAQRYKAWLGLASAFFGCLEQKCRGTGWSVREMGYPTLEHFDLLEHRDAEGNCWFAKFRHGGTDEWLLWVGYQTDDLREIIGEKRPWPSIFFGQHTDDPASVHPYESRFEAHGARPAEISFVPGNSKPVLVRWDHRVEELQTDEAAAVVVKALCR